MNTTANLRIRHRVAAAATALLIVGTGLVASAGAASAVTSSPQGAGWVNRTAAGAVSSSSTTGAKPALNYLGNGKWAAKFTGISGGFGVPAVTPGNQYPGAMCAIDGYPVVAGNVTVTFHCTDHQGIPVQNDFTVTYTSITGAVEGWADADQPYVDGSYKPTAQYNAIGLDVAIAHGFSAPGLYTVDFPGLATAPVIGSLTVSPVTSGMGHCTTAPASVTGETLLYVKCFNISGAPADVRFVVHVVGARGVLASATPQTGWALDPYVVKLGPYTPPSIDRYTSNAKKVTINHTAVGTYVYTFKGLAANASRAAQAYGFGFGVDARCGAVASTKGADAVVTVKCVSSSGVAADAVVTADFLGV